MRLFERVEIPPRKRKRVMSFEVSQDKGQLKSAASDEVMISFRDVNKWFGDFHVLKDIHMYENL